MKVTFKINCNNNLFVTINPNLIEEAVINLVNNAVTYSPEQSTVIIAASLHSKEGQKNRLLIGVEDQGIGIEKEHQERLFERFYRTDKARSSANGGTGLGLSIVKHIAMAHGGVGNGKERTREGFHLHPSYSPVTGTVTSFPASFFP